MSENKKDNKLSADISRSLSNKRIAKNTVALYVRMVFAMLVSLYTSRVILNTLGVKDFGTYNIVGGIVVFFTIINDSMVGSIQRFLNFEKGRNNSLGITEVFSASIRVQVIVALLVIFLSETIGLYYLNHYINLPPNRLFAANCVYQLSILTTSIRIFRAPFNAAVIAYERMTIFAIVSIVDVCIKLVIVYFLLVIPGDKLINYAILLTLLSLSISAYYFYYTHSRFPLCRITRSYNRLVLKQILNFSGWNIFGSVARLATFQGVDLLINYFHGVTLNASLAIANQVSGAAVSFYSGFQTAFKPQIFQSYAHGDMKSFFEFIYNTTKYSYYLVIICAIPLLFQCKALLSLWLGIVPDYTVQFCYFTILLSVVDAIAAPLWMSAQATGDVKQYFIIVSSILFLNFPISGLCLYLDFSPIWVLVIRLLITCVAYIYRIFFLKDKVNLPIREYFQSSIIPCLIVTIPILVVSVSTVFLMPFLHAILMSIFLFVVSLTTIFCFGLTRQERIEFKAMIRSKFIR